MQSYRSCLHQITMHIQRILPISIYMRFPFILDFSYLFRNEAKDFLKVLFF